ncbi:fumarylacetoacetate hydrolase family protein [Paenibacillus sp. J5C_2022]|uniref:fumarylacetoacetate hydrolase family protein n=1 Tax=Paenibacillus sp. J5C2022 TaxID=2977129 RepID=UPI0021D197D4|nr:fumarylacetoacetate hydrolase family protein [Paenibacillus sp. J5C2022]MCU6711288.1 fumarylacetoacetate hydrolase family protein [Paenibacillus sp. J5C2022]
MKLITFVKEDRLCLGVRTDMGVLDVELAAHHLSDSYVPNTILEVIEDGAKAIEALNKLVDRTLTAKETIACWLNEANLQLGPCVTNPGKIICVGLNYRKHAEETNLPVPEHPVLFNKFSNALAADGEDIVIPKVTTKVDYEAELVIVIGKKAKYVSKEEALGVVFGYCNANDVSARDLQLRTQQWLLGKTCDGFSPIGPYLVTADEVGNPNQLAIRSIVNGEVRQNSNTSDMIFYCDEIISYISQHFTLLPGDMILTGTPEGVVMGYPPELQVYLKEGDNVTIEIEKLGSLTNRFVAE